MFIWYDDADVGVGMVLQTFFSVCLSAHSFGGIQTISLHDFRLFNSHMQWKILLYTQYVARFINMDLSSENAFSISNPYEYI